MRRYRFAALWCALVWLGGGVAWGAAAATAAAPAPVPAAATQSDPVAANLPADAYTYRIPLLRQSGGQALTLGGEEAYAGMDFGVRQDERVISARLDLDYSYSPTLLPVLSHLNVLLNSVVGQTIALPEPVANGFQHISVDLPVSLLSGFNHLNLELIAHSKASDQGNDPLSADLWLKAGPGSALELTVVPLGVTGDLSSLPAPFFDVRDVRSLSLPVVLPATPGSGRLVSAGIVASWFGAQAGYRGAHFSASPGAIPAHGHAMVLALPGEIPGLTVPVAEGPTLAIVPNPNDANGKLLLITGRNEAEIREAATALVLGSRSLSGTVAKIVGTIHVLPRKPYDAPSWLPSDRPVQLGELLAADRFTVRGFKPGSIDVGLHLPPGLFGFENDGAILHLHYRYTGRPESTQSELQVLIGNTPIQRLPLPGNVSDGDAVVRIPTYLLPPLTTLQFDYRYEAVKPKDNWEDVPGGPLESAIDPTSTIDISHLPRYAAMPDLRAFGEAGFPFTRMADLSDTAVILPQAPVAADYSAYLTLMGSMGQATGYPVLGVTIGDAQQPATLRNKDLLVLASGDNQALLKAWHDDLPRGYFGPDALPRSTLRAFWDKLTRNGEQATHEAAIDALYGNDDHDGMIAGLESPLTRGRSVVVVSGNTPDGLDAVVNLLQANRYLDGTRPDNKVSGSLVIAHDGVLTTLNRQQSYFVGSLPPRLGFQWFFANHILLLMVSTLISIVLIGLIGGVFLHQRALSRLDLDLSQTPQHEEGTRDSNEYKTA